MIGTARASIRCPLVLACALVGSTGCESCRALEQPPESRLVATPMPGGGWLVEVRAEIPKDQQVNCDVCPYWCTQLDLRPVPMDELMAAYRDVARHYVYDASGQSDDSWRWLERMGCIAAAAGTEDKARFMTLLGDPEIAVRYVAAVHCLGHGMATEEPLEVLREIASSEHELALDARIKLNEHASGIKLEL